MTVYQAALDISTRAKTVPAALINGFGEAGEEVLDDPGAALAQPQVDPDEVLNAALMGRRSGWHDPGFPHRHAVS